MTWDQPQPDTTQEKGGTDEETEKEPEEETGETEEEETEEEETEEEDGWEG